MKSMERKVAPGSEYFVYTPSRAAEKTFFYPMQCGLFTYEPGYRLARQSFDSFLLMYVQKGEMRLDLAGRRRAVGAGEFALVDCYQPHGYATEAGYECLWLHFDGVMARAYCELVFARLGNVFAMSDAFPVLRRMRAILRVFQEKQPVWEPMMSRYISDILTEFMLCPPARARGDAAMAERAVAYINEHFSEDVPVERLAAAAGLSPCHFIRVFRRETGYTPHAYLLNRRMASARYLLKSTSLSVKEIALNAGFSSESVFCGAFKKRFGVTPGQYRQEGSDAEESVPPAFCRKEPSIDT